MAQKKSAGSNAGFVTTIVVVVVLFIVVAVGYSLYSQRDTSGRSGDVPRNTVDDYYMAVGSADAPKTMKVFEDFQCPYCQQFEQAGGALLQQAANDGKVRILYHPMAFLDQASTTDYSTRALNAFGVVLDSSGPEIAKKYHDLLYENQPAEGSAGLSDDRLIALAVQAGAKETDVSKGIKDLVFKQWTVNATNDASKNEGITGTPTIKVDGQTITYKDLPDLMAQLDAALGLSPTS